MQAHRSKISLKFALDGQSKVYGCQFFLCKSLSYEIQDKSITIVSKLSPIFLAVNAFVHYTRNYSCFRSSQAKRAVVSSDMLSLSGSGSWKSTTRFISVKNLLTPSIWRQLFVPCVPRPKKTSSSENSNGRCYFALWLRRIRPYHTLSKCLCP